MTPAIAAREEFATLVKEIAMQIAAASPTYASRADVPADVLEKEKAIYRAQMENSGQAGQRHRQDRRRQARELLRAGRAARPAVDPRPEDDGRRTCSPRPTRRSARSVTVTRFARLKVGEAAQ